MNNTVQDTIKWWNKFNQENISISGKTTNFKIKINDNSLPHLLGIQYINENYKVARGKDLLNYVSKNRLSDEKIYSLIQKNNPELLDSVKNRIDSFKFFMENLEKGMIVEMTNPNTRIKSNFLIVQTEDNCIMQLGIKDIGYEDVFETFFIRQDNDYFKNTTLNEPIISIQKYNEKGELEKFSFRETPEVEEIYNISIDDKLQSISYKEELKDIERPYRNIENTDNIFGDTLNIFPEDDIDLER